MECDEWVAVREQGSDNMVAMCNLNTGSVKKKKINADGVLMYSGNLIALRLKTDGGSTLQCYEGTSKISSVKVSHSNISFWTFLDKNTVGYVSGESVYHWNIRGSSKPKKVFSKIPSLSGCQVINYVASSDLKWLLLSGIKKGSNGSIEGKMMLYSVEKKKPQAISGHTGTFADVTLEGQTQPVTVVAFTETKPGIKGRVQIMQVGGRKAGETPFRIKPVNIPFPAEAVNDFPIAMQASPKHDVVYMVTKSGYVYLFDIHSGTALFRQRFSQDPVFATCPHTSTSGILCVTAGKGKVLSVSLNEQNLVPFVMKVLNNRSLALKLSSRLNLPGADDMYTQQFEALLAAGNIKGAAEIAARSPRGILRNAETIARFQRMPATPGQHPPVLQYFQVLLGRGRLNKLESIELARPVVKQGNYSILLPLSFPLSLFLTHTTHHTPSPTGKTPLLTKWITEDKLEPSAELGDLVSQLDVKIAVKIYKEAKEHDKVVQCLIQLGMIDRVMQYCQKMNHRADWIPILSNLVRRQPGGPEQATSMAIKLATNPGGAILDVGAAVDVFMQYVCVGV